MYEGILYISLNALKEDVEELASKIVWKIHFDNKETLENTNLEVWYIRAGRRGREKFCAGSNVQKRIHGPVASFLFAKVGGNKKTLITLSLLP